MCLGDSLNDWWCPLKKCVITGTDEMGSEDGGGPPAQTGLPQQLPFSLCFSSIEQTQTTSSLRVGPMPTLLGTANAQDLKSKAGTTIGWLVNFSEWLVVCGLCIFFQVVWTLLQRPRGTLSTPLAQTRYWELGHTLRPKNTNSKDPFCLSCHNKLP